MSAMASQITGVSIVCLTVCSGADQRKHERSASLVFVRGIHRWPVDHPHKGPLTRKMFPFDDVIMEKVRRNRAHITRCTASYVAKINQILYKQCRAAMVMQIEFCFINILRLRQNGRHFADGAFKRNFLNEIVRISKLKFFFFFFEISLKFVPKGPIKNMSALVQIIAWSRQGDEPIADPMVVRLTTHADTKGCHAFSGLLSNLYLLPPTRNISIRILRDRMQIIHR